MKENSSSNKEMHQNIDPISVSQAVRMVFKNSIFIIFSFINLFIPFFATMMASLNGPNGIIDIIAVGLSTSFITIFNQFLFLLSLTVLFIFVRQKKLSIRSNIDKNAVASIVFVMAIFAMILFVGLSFLYIHFSGIYKNIDNSIWKGFKYVGIVAPSLMFNAFIYLNILYRHRENHKSAWMLLVSFFLLNIILIPLIGVLPHWDPEFTTFGIGTGILSASVVMFAFIFFLNVAHGRVYFYGFNFSKVKYFISKINNFIYNFLLSTGMKSILIMAIALSLGLAQREGTPVALMVTKIIWYNSLFFCGFYADGLLYAIEYTRLIHIIRHEDKKYLINFKVWNLLILSGTIVTALVSLAFSFASFGLADLYVAHQATPIPSPTDGLVQFPNNAWPYGPNKLSQEIKDYLWCPTGMPNFQLVDKTNFTIGKSCCIALLYTGLYHTFINTTKLMSFVDIRLDQKFSWKKIISNFIVISFVMIFVVVFSVVPDSKGYHKVFGGIDNFSFSLMVVSILLFLLTIFGHMKKMKVMKQHGLAV